MILDEFIDLLSMTLENPSGEAKVVDKKSGEWFSVNVKKVANFDYDELLNFKSIFIYDYLQDNIMRSKVLGISLLKPYVVNRFFQQDVLEDNFFENGKFLKVANLIMDESFFNFGTDRVPAKILKVQKDYQKRFISVLALNLLNNKNKLQSDSLFYQLTKNVQEEVVLCALQNTDSLRYDTIESNISKVSKVLGVKESHELIKLQKNYKNIKNILCTNLNILNSEPLVFGDFFNYFEEDIKTHINLFIKEYLSGRSIPILKELSKRYPLEFKNSIKESDTIDLLAGMNKENYKDLIDFTHEYTDYKLWQREGVCIKSLYSQGKRDVLVNILREYPIDMDEYYLLEDFMKKRSVKDDSKREDYEHLQKYTYEIVLEQKLLESIPNNNTIPTRKLKF